MAQRLSTSFVNTNRPGAYVETLVRSTPTGVGSVGNIIIIGEADGGAAYSAESLVESSFTPDQVDRIQAKYIRGPIVEAARALSAPSNDADIQGSVNRIFILKTNAGAKASSEMPGAYGTLLDQNFGEDGNAISYRVLHTREETAPQTTGITIPAFGGDLDGASFSIRLEGGAEATVTLSTDPLDHDDLATLVAELNGLLPAGITAEPGDAADTLRLVMEQDAMAHTRATGRSFELIDSTPGDLQALGLSEGLFTAATEPAAEINVARQDTGAEETLAFAADIALTIGYEGATAEMTIDAQGVMAIVVTGGAGTDLTVDTKKYSTIRALAEFINSKTGYTAAAISAFAQRPTSDLDRGFAANIASTAAQAMPGRIKRGLRSTSLALETSRFVDFAATATAGIPAETPMLQFLAGGARGATTGADIVDALAKAEGVPANFVVPLFSRDAATDIADGITDDASTYTIDAIHAAARTHVLKMSQVKIKRNRSALLSFDGAYSDAKQKAGTAASFRATVCMQRTQQSDAQGVTRTFQPWYQAVIAAGMQSAGFYKAIVNKLANITGLIDPQGFDSGNPGDIEDALDAGLLFMENVQEGIRWVSDQTTYGVDENFVYNSLQAVYAADLVSLDLADSLETRFVGKSLADVSAETALGFIANKMDEYRKSKLIAASDDAPLGYKNAKVSISGPVMTVSVEIKLATAIYFIPITLEISAVQQTA